MTEDKEKIRIIEAVIEEFNEKSLKFTMDDLAKKLEMSKKTIYTFFPDKENMLLEAVEYGFNAIKASEKMIMEDSSLDVVEKLRRILIVMPEKYKNIDFRQVYVMKERYPRIYKRIEARIDSQWEDTIQLIQEGIRQKKIRNISIPIFKSMFESAIMGFLGNKTLIECQISYETAMEQMLDIMMGGIVL